MKLYETNLNRAIEVIPIIMLIADSVGKYIVFPEDLQLFLYRVEEASATPRSWERVSTLIKSGFTDTTDFNGAVGVVPASYFAVFYANSLAGKKNGDSGYGDVGTKGPGDKLNSIKKKR